jgi:hypothetical protein
MRPSEPAFLRTKSRAEAPPNPLASHTGADSANSSTMSRLHAYLE